MTHPIANDTAVRVRVGRGVEREAVILEDRGSTYRVLYTDTHEGGRPQTDTVLHERVRVVNVRRAPIIPPAIAELRARNAESIVASIDALPSLRAVSKPPKPWRSAAYLAHVRYLPVCACCGERATSDDPMEASHHGPRGMSRKADDSRAIPLRRSCHRYYHDHGVFRGSDSSEPMTREKTDALAKNAASASLYAYAAADGIDVDNIIIDALTAALRERS